MAVSISLWSGKEGEIKRFLHSYYQNDVTNSCTNRWIEQFYKPLETIDIISALMDNSEYYDVAMYIHMENGYLYKITKENYNDVIKGLLGIYYFVEV